MIVQVSSDLYWTPPEVEGVELAVAMVDLLPVDVNDVSHTLHQFYIKCIIIQTIPSLI